MKTQSTTPTWIMKIMFFRMRTAYLLALLALLVAGSGTRAEAQTPEDFGYNHMTLQGKEARGARPLLVILAEFDGYPDMAHDRDYYDNLVFNYFWADANGNPRENLNAWYIENSNGRFYWTRANAGTYGPYHITGADLGETPGTKAQPRQALLLKKVAEDGFNFADYDENGDGYVTNDELCVLVIENLSVDGAANRSTEPRDVQPEGADIKARLDIAIVAHQASLMSMCHELAHSLGTIDVYGADSLNEDYSAMGATIDGAHTPDVRRLFHLDPWHKMQLGWVEPKIHSLDFAGQDSLGVAQLTEGDEPVILYSPDKGTNEFFMLEYRANALPGGASAVGYDRNVRGTGLVIWHVITDDNKKPLVLPSQTKTGGTDMSVFMNGAPSFTRGKGQPWTKTNNMLNPALSGVVPYALKWLNGVGGEMKIKVGATSADGNRLNVSWDNYNLNGEPPPAPYRILYYNSTEQTAAVGAIDQNKHFTLKSYDPGYFSAWTHIVEQAGNLFYYNNQTGAAALGYVDAAGNHSTVWGVGAGYFGTGWTHIVHHAGYLFFYSSTNGMAAIGQVTPSGGFRQFTHYPAGTFGRGWTSIVSTPNGLLFYNAANGSGAVGVWDVVMTGIPGGFGFVSSVKFRQIKGYPAGSFTAGWSQIVNTSNGILFYRRTDGRNVMADVDAAGAVITRMNTHQNIRPGYTTIVSVGEDILLYNSVNGDAALGSIIKASPWVISRAVGKLSIKQDMPGSFSTGWSHIAAVIHANAVR